MSNVTFILTSCGRLDLLEKTLDSFFKWNTHPIDQYIITEDSADPKVFEECIKLNNEKYNGKLEFIFNYKKLGQSLSIDKAYSMVKTEFIFHLEDDWEFYSYGFIEKSIDILNGRPDILQVWIRPKSDGILNKICSEIFYTELGVPYRTVNLTSFYTGRILENGEKEVVSNYMGFSYNPGIKRYKDFIKLGSGGYTQFGQEHLVDHFYRDLGYKVVSLSINDNDGYVKHLGWSRRVVDHIH